MKKRLILASLCSLACSAAFAQSAPSTAQLEARLDALEQQLVQGGRNTADTGLPLHGFADISFGRSTPREAREAGEATSGFAVGSVDFYLSPNFGDRVKTLIELVFEVDGDGSLATDLERVQVGYTINDAATLWMGRFHVPYGYWNTAFHHGQQIQTSVSRPRFVNFEDAGGILPAHGTGLWAAGNVPSVIGKVGYDVYVTNAPEISRAGSERGALDMMMGGKHARTGAMTGFNLSLKPAALSDVTIGLHGLRAKVDEVDSTTATLNNTTKVNMVGGYLNYQDDNWEALSEYYRFTNRGEQDATSRGSEAWFAQVGYNFGVVTPYIRAEAAQLDQGDAYFQAQASGDSYRRSVVGGRYDLNAKAALKVEASRTQFTDPGTTAINFSEARVELAVRF